MNRMKKTAALGLAALLCAGLAACGEKATWAATYGDTTVPAGVYITGLMTEYNSLIGQAPADAKDPLKAEVDGVTLSQQITQGAKDRLNDYIAIEEQFAAMGLELAPEDQAAVESGMTGWDYFRSIYEENGVSQESYRLVMVNSAKQQRLFESIYGPGGTEEVPESDLRAAFEEDYAKVLMVPLTFSTSEDQATKEEADQKTRETIDGFYEQLQNGADMEDIYYEARKLATGNDELERPEPGTSYTFVNKTNTSYDQVLVDAIFNAQVGEPVRVETDGGLYLFVRYDLNEDPQDFETYRDSILMSLKREEFLGKFDQWASQLSDVTYNQEALDRYTPEKLKFR